MNFLQAVRAQWRIWQAAASLGSPDDAERAQAMQVLECAGHQSIPHLRHAVRSSFPRTQFAAAVVLHRLGDPEGMAILSEALQYRLPLNPNLAPELESTFVAVGAPDAVTLLLKVWGQLPEWTENQQALHLICRVWARLRDPRALDALCLRAQRIPDLFLETIPAFGTAALPHLSRMAAERDPQRRMLAARALASIPGEESLEIFHRLLRDEDPDVRAAVPEALLIACGTQKTGAMLLAALQEHYSTAQLVEMLARLGDVPVEPLLDLVSRWDPQTRTPAGDTGGSVKAALVLLQRVSCPNSQLIPVLCALLQRKPDADLTTEIAHLIGVRGRSGGTLDREVRETLLPLLAHTDARVREAAARALNRLGDAVGQRMLQLLAECRLQGNLLSRLEALIRGGPEATAIAAQTMQQVSQWVSRLSREKGERIDHSRSAGQMHRMGSRDPRLIGLLRRLLDNTLTLLPRLSAFNEVNETLMLAASAIRALARLGRPAAAEAHAELRRALRCVRRSLIHEEHTGGAPRRSEVREVGTVVRTTAAEALIELYGPDSFPFFLEALYAPHPECAETAILVLGRLGDARALPHLQRFVTPAETTRTDSKSSTTLSAAAVQAIAAIRRTNPDVMTLLRASTVVDSRPDTLLRPAAGYAQETASEALLRPATPEADNDRE
ncbi:MAG: HEAT repeat domain-containing protein [Chloroherpetonaceae bacterium]|nr:HEAT repeat domain-containing protein [Chthonomonadaceae bacterium]MDW8206509.1 HEAT repeat domain-containing protein [Chloroherpetonaceae bacterium]